MRPGTTPLGGVLEGSAPYTQSGRTSGGPPDRTTNGGRPGARRSRLWYLLLVPPFVGLLWLPLYAQADPKLLGIPFFYWYQFAWVPVTAVLIWVVYRRVR